MKVVCRSLSGTAVLAEERIWPKQRMWVSREDPIESDEMERQAHCKGKGSAEERVPPTREVASERKCTV